MALSVFDVTGECGDLYSHVHDANARGAKNKRSAEILGRKLANTTAAEASS